MHLLHRILRAKVQSDQRSVINYGNARYYGKYDHPYTGNYRYHSVGSAAGNGPFAHSECRRGKIQKMVAMEDVTPEVLLATNKSVESMVNAVSRLEMILQSKLSTFEGYLGDTAEPTAPAAE